MKGREGGREEGRNTAGVFLGWPLHPGEHLPGARRALGRTDGDADDDDDGDDDDDDDDDDGRPAAAAAADAAGSARHCGR